MPDLPTGTVTFLLTDLVGSTRLTEQHPEALGKALDRHEALLREAVEGRGGHIVKTFGDGVLAAFATAPSALAAALDAQRALQSEPWGEIGPLRVCMALHTGAAVERHGDYLGPTLNRCFRLLEASHGGQILLSLATQELAHDHLPEGASLRDLGEHRLKGLVQPVRVFQLIAPDLPADFPPLKTLDRLETVRLLRGMSQEILSCLDREAILVQLTGELPAIFPAKSATLLLSDPTDGIYRQAGPEGESVALSPHGSVLLPRLQETGRPVSTYDPQAPGDGPQLSTSPSQDVMLAPSEQELSQRLGAALWVPVMLQGRPMGVLALGAKLSGEVYTEEELDALCMVANGAASALEIAALSAERERQARLQQEVAIARSIQMRLLPPPRLRLERFEILSRSEPATEVGGDFYNLFQLPAGGEYPDLHSAAVPTRLGVLLGDVAGKGVAAALFMAVTTTLIQGQARLLPSPTATLAAANAELYPKMRQQGGGQPLFATAVYGVLDPASGEMRLANAGQTPPIHWPASGQPHYVRLTGVPLGGLPGSSYEEAVIHLAPGDRLLFCTDGFIEEQGSDTEPVGYDGFLCRLMALHERSGRELIEALFADHGGDRGDLLHRDDRTLVLITVLTGDRGFAR
jgi:serine phosphatase RsbU (regulator of sigma subunit)/class 3 adenylate cyclase